MEWSDLDRAKALAYQVYVGEACPRCHTRHEEWDPKQGGDRFAYIADVDYCPGCAALAEMEEQIGTDDRKAGANVGLLPRAVYEAKHADEEG